MAYTNPVLKALDSVASNADIILQTWVWVPPIHYDDASALISRASIQKVTANARVVTLGNNALKDVAIEFIVLNENCSGTSQSVVNEHASIVAAGRALKGVIVNIKSGNIAVIAQDVITVGLHNNAMAITRGRGSEYVIIYLDILSSQDNPI